MFCNGPKTDEGDIARLGPTTITGMTILKVLFVLDHDSGWYRWFGWASQLPPYSWGRPYLRRVQEYEEVLDILYVYIYVLPSSSFFFFFLRLGLCSALMAHWWRGTRCGHVFDSDWLGSLVFDGNLFSFPHFSRQRPFDINLSFLLFLPLATFLLSFCVWCL